jgi:hypothetical protein
VFREFLDQLDRAGRVTKAPAPKTAKRRKRRAAKK